MKTPRDLYGRELADHLIRHWDYRESRQAGSHILIRTETPAGQSIPIPAHKPLRTGTLNAIVRMVSEHKKISREEVLRGI